MKRCAEALAVAGLLLSACTTMAPPPQATTSRAQPRVPAAADGEALAAGARSRFDAALKLMQDGEREQAIAALQSLCNDYPQFSGPCTDLGILYSKLQRRDAAMAAFTQAVQRNPENVVALNHLAGLYRETGDYLRAEQTYQQAQRACHDYAPSYLNLGILYELSLHRPQQALMQYQLYRQYAGAQAQPMVAVWIKELELANATPSTRLSAGAQK